MAILMRSYFANAALCCFFVSTYASVLQLPIRAHYSVDDSAFAHDQAPLGRPVKSFQNLVYKTNISIGTPPQMFDVALDATMSEMFVPSATCSKPCDGPSRNRYNSSESSTYWEAGGYVSTKWGGVNYNGFLSYDTIHLGDNKVTGILFEEWTTASCYSFGCLQVGYEGLLGLAFPRSMGRSRRSMLSVLRSQKTLDEPIFSLKLPVGLHEEGEILFGAVDTKLNSSAFIDLPVVNVTRDPNAHDFDSWAVPASHISFASPRPLEVPLSINGFAVLDMGNPYTFLPQALAHNLTAAIGALPGPLWMHNVPCERRQELPSLTFTLDGHNFSISAFEYTFELDLPQYPWMCVLSIISSTSFGYPADWDGIVLGSAFFKGFYSKWDFENGKVGLAKLK